MNRWLNRKNRDGGVDEATAPKKTKKSRKTSAEPKPELDMAFALPTVDEFRTSLIMPGLSTRFSMLREQDDPASKIGKASDDSVLHPKRQSRLHEFGFVAGGLSDIAEVSSLHGSIRPPYAAQRKASFDSSRDDEGTGSIMSRSRPGEGNVLFGGRQKIYVIPNHSAKGFGRTLYDDDVNLSAYQKLRQEEKERLRQELEDQQDPPSEPSSPTASSQKRDTSSSTNSGPLDTRTSTAATSIASQGANAVPTSSPAFSPTAATHPHPPEANRSTGKARRLYDQGLDQHIQEQQSSSMNRLNSIQRARAPTGHSTPPMPLPVARSATNGTDRYNRGPTTHGSDSPNPLGQQPTVTQGDSAGSSPVLSPPLSPPLTSPSTSDADDAHALSAALQPHDRGKATAMGAFNKPKEAFSEEQYAERLRHMQQGNGAPQMAVPSGKKSSPRKPSLRERAEQAKRNKSHTGHHEQPGPLVTDEQAPIPSAFSRFQAAVSQMKSSGPESLVPPPLRPERPTPDVETAQAQNGATLHTSHETSDTDEEVAVRPLGLRPSEPSRRFENLPVATGPAPPIYEHPAMRSRAVSEVQAPQVARPGQHTRSDLSAQLSVDVDSPTLGPDAGGLSGMIRQHLRSESEDSSNYDVPGPVVNQTHGNAPVGLAIHTQTLGFQRQHPGSNSATPVPSTDSHSSPWDVEDVDHPSRQEPRSKPTASLLDPQDMQPLVMSATKPNGGASWDLTPRGAHERTFSNETQADHDAFQRDLAHRQRLIQENLRARAEGRSTSPAPAAAGHAGGLKTALNMLRAKSSRESFATVAEQQSSNKSVRKLALGATSANASSASLINMHGGEMPPLRSKASRILQQSEQDAQRETRSRQRSGTETSRTGRPTGRSPAVSTTRSSTRDRSGSGNSSGRSRSRPGDYRDDLDQAMAEGTRAAYPANTLPSISGYVANATPPLPAQRPSIEVQNRARSRSNSKTTASHYLEPRHLHPIQTGAGVGRGRHSPGIPVSPRPSPSSYHSPASHGYPTPTSPMPPFSANPMPPPVSHQATPSAAAFTPSTVQPMTRQSMPRKKSIAKCDISEPVFLSTTSVIDTVNLPPGASLKNGTDYYAPPVPPINPMRRKFGFGRGEPHGPHDHAVSHVSMDTPRVPFAEPMRTNSADAAGTQMPKPRARLRKTSSESKSLRGDVLMPPGPSPVVPQAGFIGRNRSPSHALGAAPMPPQRMEGAMF